MYFNFIAMHQIVENDPPKLTIPHTPHLGDFLHRCMQKDPRKRPHAQMLLRHPWITSEKIPIPLNAITPFTLSLEELCDNTNEFSDEESDSDESDEETDDEEEYPNQDFPSISGTQEKKEEVVIEDDYEEEEEEEENLPEDIKEIRNYHKEFQELILWLHRALDQQNKKQARRLCDVIQGRDKPLRLKYGNHPEAKELISSLNVVLSRYYKVCKEYSNLYLI
jgi:serine/threonine protein kinase